MSRSCANIMPFDIRDLVSVCVLGECPGSNPSQITKGHCTLKFWRFWNRRKKCCKHQRDFRFNSIHRLRGQAWAGATQRVGETTPSGRGNIRHSGSGWGYTWQKLSERGPDTLSSQMPASVQGDPLRASVPPALLPHRTDNCSGTASKFLVIRTLSCQEAQRTVSFPSST